MVLARLEVTRPKQDREYAHDQGYVKSCVLQEESARRGSRHHDLEIVQQHREAGRYRLELQRDVRKYADHRDNGDETAELKALAVSRGDEIRDRRDAVNLADADDLADNEPCNDEGECRAEIDRQEIDARRRSPADRAVERPGGAVDGDRQGIEGGIGDQTPPLVGTLVAIIGDCKQQAEIKKGDGDNDGAAKHRGAPPL